MILSVSLNWIWCWQIISQSDVKHMTSLQIKTIMFRGSQQQTLSLGLTVIDKWQCLSCPSEQLLFYVYCSPGLKIDPKMLIWTKITRQSESRTDIAVMRNFCSRIRVQDHQIYISAIFGFNLWVVRKSVKSY